MSPVAISCLFIVALGVPTFQYKSKPAYYLIVFDDTEPQFIRKLQEFVATLAKNLRSGNDKNRVAVATFSNRRSTFEESEFRVGRAMQQVILDLKLPISTSTISGGFTIAANELSTIDEKAVKVIFIIGSRGQTAKQNEENENAAKAFFKNHAEVTGFVIGAGQKTHEKTLAAIGGSLSSGRRWEVEDYYELASVEKEITPFIQAHKLSN